MEALILARLQFAFTVSFHILFPSLTIGLASYLAFLEVWYLRTRNHIYLDVYKFWAKVFAIAFGMGVVSGVVMSYQFGTNWAPFSDKISGSIGPLLGFEVLTAFFLEASFLGIMLFGWNRVTPKAHCIATVIVAFGTIISAFWILSANSWMQTPQGFAVNDGRFEASSWLEIIFNPSFPYRFAHMLCASYLTTGFVIGAVGAFYLRRNSDVQHAKIMLGMATIAIVMLTPLQAIIGDLHGLNTLEYQPAKVAAIEGIWHTEREAPLRIFALPDEVNEVNSYEVSIPKLGSIILTHSTAGEIKGLTEWKADDRPPVMPVFIAFRVMVGLWLVMLFVAIASTVRYMQSKLFTSKLLHNVWIFMAPSGFVAMLAGWIVTECGRQPYTVYGVLRTIDSVSSNINTLQTGWSLLSFVLVYSMVFGMGTYYILKVIRLGIAAKGITEPFYEHTISSSVKHSTIHHED